MAKLKLSDEEKLEIIEAINNGVEPSPDLIPKLFPQTNEKFSPEMLERAKIPTLEYAGKRSKAAILAEATAGIGAAPLQTVRCFRETEDDEWRNMIVQGDNLQFLKTCYKNVDPLIKDKVKGKVKLIYIDPPFATKSDFGGKDGEYSYSDKVDRARFLEDLRERLIYLRELIADDGSIYVHLDQKMSHYVKIVMDEVYGKDNLKNEIIWAYSGPSPVKSRFPQKHDTILFYSFAEQINYEDILIPYDKATLDRRAYSETQQGGIAFKGKDVSEYENGRVPADWWKDIPSGGQISRNELVNYPTQKPEKLLERIILASSGKDDLVIDLFAGSGTTAAVAEKLGRRWIMCDFGKHSIYIMQKRIWNISESKKIGILEEDDSVRCDECNSVTKENESHKKCNVCGVIYEKDVKPTKEKYGLPPKPFCVVSTGAYDFSHVMDLRKNKDTYIDFVLGLFQLARDDEKAVKFRLSNIYGLRDGNPVEIYPVWDDEYLKEIRIDEQYLQSILDQTGGRLKGDYYIISPESCTNVGNTTLKNQDGVDVNFKILTFPYKILEDISQKLTLEEQPSSADNINNLVTSTSFYFNEDVEIEMERIEDGLKITKFDTKILDANKNRFEGLMGLAMLLIDLNHEPEKPFDMDMAVYAKEIEEDGSFKVSGLTDSVGVIAIDKHGNESKPYQIK